MISLAGKAKVLEKLAIDNSPVLLTAIGVAGTIGTAVLTHRAATKTVRVLDNERAKMSLQDQSDFNADRKAKLTLVWKHYIPPAITGTLTAGAIIMANHIGTKRAAALAAAYTISEKAYTEYREKVIEKIGEKDERKVRESIAQDAVRNNPMTEGNVLMVGGGEHLFMEMYTGRYFRSSIETVRKAVNDVNFQINTHGYASVSDFYQRIGLPNTTVSEEMGWTSDKLMDVDYVPVLSEDGQPCVAIQFITGPVRDYARFH